MYKFSRLFWLAFALLVVLGCNETPELQPCNEICDNAKPAACEGPGEILSIHDLVEEEPLGTSSHWMCVCPAIDDFVLQYLAPRAQCQLPRGGRASGVPG